MYVLEAACIVYTCRRLIDLSLIAVDAACCVYTCRRLIDLSLIACIYMPAIDRPLE